MTSPDLLTPAEVAALFRVDSKTVTRWAQQKMLSSIRTVGGHRRYRAAEVYELLNSERRSGFHAAVETLVDDHYDGDPTRAVIDLAERYGLAVLVLDRAWFTQIARRDLTEVEWKHIAAELQSFSSAVSGTCADQLLDYASTVLRAADVAVTDIRAADLPRLPAAPSQHEAAGESIAALDKTAGDNSGPQPPPVANEAEGSQLALTPQPATMPEQLAAAGAVVPAPARKDINRLVPHSTRVWNYLLGGHDHYEADRKAADAFAELYPAIAELMAAQRAFGNRAVKYLAQQGVRQFIDIGPGLPSPRHDSRATDTHTAARSAAEGTRVVYVDNDPLVIAHARALLTGGPGCAVGHVDADLTDTRTVLASAAQHLDLHQPIAVLLLAVMGHIDDTEAAYAIVRTLIDGVAPGSFLVLSDAVATSTALSRAQDAYNATGAVPYRLRTPTQVAGFFTGLDPVQPGLVPPALWRPGPSPSAHANNDARCAVAMTPLPYPAHPTTPAEQPSREKEPTR
ncbi:BldC family transcriptional regulator [Spirillospora sp. NPDC047418]